MFIVQKVIIIYGYKLLSGRIFVSGDFEKKDLNGYILLKVSYKKTLVNMAYKMLL